MIDKRTLDAIKRSYASIWRDILGEEPPDEFKTDEPDEEETPSR